VTVAGDDLHAFAHGADDRTDRRLTRLLGLSTAVLVAVLLFAVIAVPAIFRGRDSSAAVERGTNLQACRSIAHTAVDQANTVLTDARADVENLTSLGLSALVRNDPATLDKDDANLATARDRVDQAVAELTAANSVYARQVQESKDQPDQFLRDCAKFGN
jgi:hypothetical protein